MKYPLYILTILIFISSGHAQSPCATPPYEANLSVENQINDWILKNKTHLQTRSTTTIPVVVHIVYNSITENMTDAEVSNQINVLNRDFRRRNSDTTQTPSVWKPLGADIEIEFCLANRDTIGNVTTGITHTQTTALSFTNANNVKNPLRGGVGNWNPRKYLNIWVCNLSPLLFGVGSYPTFLNSRPQDDGVVINYRNFGVKSYKITGRVLVHEVGHWLNLLHIFGDSIASICEARTDFVDDTPLQKDASSGCASFPKVDACTSSGNGNMFMNYMDYTDEPCMNLFTNGQKERMLAALNLFRPEILKSDGCLIVPTKNIALSPFKVSPNPINDRFIKIEHVDKNADLMISNVYGQVILTLKNIDETALIDFSKHPPGMYFITLQKGYKSLTVKVLLCN